MEQEQSEADVGTKLESAPRMFGRQLITDDMQMRQERRPELVGEDSDSVSGEGSGSDSGSGSVSGEGEDLESAPRMFGRQLITDDMQMRQERRPELVGEDSDSVSGEGSGSGSSSSSVSGEGEDSDSDSDSVSLWMKPEVYRAITMGDKASFISEDAKHSVLDQVDLRGNTVLHVAVSLGHCELVAVIVNLYPQLMKRKNSTGDLAIHLAAGSGHQLMVKRMVHQAKQHAGQASGSGQIDTDIEENEEIKKTASRNAQVDILKEENLEKNTALHLAMKNRHYEMARFLVEKNPRVSINLNKERLSPLYMAAEAGHLELVKLMTEKRRAEMTELMRGKSLAHAAIKGRNRDVLDAVLRYQSTDAVMGYQSTYFTPLGKGRSSFSIPFNEEGSNLFCHILFDDKGRTPLSFAASIGYLDGVRYFLDKTPAVTYLGDSNRKGFFPIHWASIRGHVKIIDEFLKRCPSSWKLLNGEGQNILHVAAESGKANVVRYILQMPECRSLINERDTDGNTPLHLATKGGQPRVVSILAWDDRVKLGVINHEGLMALDVALNYTGTVPSFEQRLTWLALRYAGAPQAPRESIRNIEDGESTQIHLRRQPRLDLDNYKDRVNTLLLVATLVVTITFFAGFTMPGGYNNYDLNQGMATLVHRSSFHVFLISNTIAMYSSILVAIILIWAQLCDLRLMVASLKFAVPLLGIYLTMVSISFMAGVHLVVSNLNWLANVVLIMGAISILALLLLFVPLFFPSSVNNRVWQYIFSYLLYPLILVIERKTNDDTNE